MGNPSILCGIDLCQRSNHTKEILYQNLRDPLWTLAKTITKNPNALCFWHTIKKRGKGVKMEKTRRAVGKNTAKYMQMAYGLVLLTLA